MNINSFLNITKFIGTKNNKYGLDKPDNFLNILDSFNELNNQNRDETIYFFNLAIEEAQLDSIVLNFYLNFFEKSSDRLIEFEKLKSSGKINFELDHYNISVLTQGNVEITSKLLSIHNIPIDDKFFLTFRYMSVNRRIEFLEFLKSKNPSFLSNLKTNNDFSNLFIIDSYGYKDKNLLLPHIINDKYFVNQLQNKSKSDFDSYIIISKLVSVSDDINNTLSKLGEKGNDFNNMMNSGDMLFFGYYKIIFYNFDNFINLFNFFGEEVVTKFFIECFDNSRYKDLVKSLVKHSQENKEYVLSMENFWVILKEKHPKEYYSGFAV